MFMKKETEELTEDVSSSPLYSEDLAPVPASKRTWSTWNLAAIWVGMAVCIPTYILASYMIRSGLSWQVALVIIGLANLIITVPMVLNGHAGVKYGVPFPVVGRAAFGTKGIHIPAILRAIVACGWFGVQTWIGGLAFYAIFNVLTGNTGTVGLDVGKFVGFAVFWFVNIYFIWKGTESIKWLEHYAAPILIGIGIVLIGWGVYEGGSFGMVLKQGDQLGKSSAVMHTDAENNQQINITSLVDKEGKLKASSFQLSSENNGTGNVEMSDWIPLTGQNMTVVVHDLLPASHPSSDLKVQFKAENESGGVVSSLIPVTVADPSSNSGYTWTFILWLTAMVGFWATMSLSIADITRYAATQKSQVTGQFIGLPGTMILYSFVGIFVTCAAVINFKDILIAEDAPWDPVTFLSRFDNPIVVVVSQFFMIIATLSTNIAANVIAPSNAFSNLFPKKLSFRWAGVVTGIIGIIICPWLLLNEISGFLIFVSGLLGPVLGIMLCDYFLIRKKQLMINELYKTDGVYSYGKTGYNRAAVIAMILGVGIALVGYWVPAVSALYKLSWFTGFIISFAVYYLLMKDKIIKTVL